MHAREPPFTITRCGRGDICCFRVISAAAVIAGNMSSTFTTRRRLDPDTDVCVLRHVTTHAYAVHTNAMDLRRMHTIVRQTNIISKASIRHAQRYIRYACITRHKRNARKKAGARTVRAVVAACDLKQVGDVENRRDLGRIDISCRPIDGALIGEVKHRWSRRDYRRHQHVKAS